MTVDDWASQMINYPNCKGFNEPPIHHYMHPFQMMNAYYGTEKTKTHIDGHLCRERHHPPLEYFQQFIDAYKGSVSRILRSLLYLIQVVRCSLGYGSTPSHMILSMDCSGWNNQ